MNSTHATVGISATTATAWLTTLLTGWHGLDSDHASAASGLIVLIIGGVIGLVSNKWPNLFSSQQGQH